MMDPPQMCWPFTLSEICQGQAWRCAFWPFTTLEPMRCPQPRIGAGKNSTWWNGEFMNFMIFEQRKEKNVRKITTLNAQLMHQEKWKKPEKKKWIMLMMTNPSWLAGSVGRQVSQRSCRVRIPSSLFFWGFLLQLHEMVLKGAVSRNSAKLGNYTLWVKRNIIITA